MTTQAIYTVVRSNEYGTVLDITGSFTNPADAIAYINHPKDRVWKMCISNDVWVFPLHLKNAVKKISHNLEAAGVLYTCRDTVFGEWITPELGVCL